MTLDPLLWMLIGHAVCDYPLQGDWLSKAKNPTLDLVNGEIIWPLAMLSHAAIQAGAVKLATGSWALAGAELVMHCLIDLAKCNGWISYNQDQAGHLACKVLWWGALP